VKRKLKFFNKTWKSELRITHHVLRFTQNLLKKVLPFSL